MSLPDTLENATSRASLSRISVISVSCALSALNENFIMPLFQRIVSET